MFVKYLGVDTNEEIKMSRSGGADPDGNQPGDLYVVIKVFFFLFKLCVCIIQIQI